MKNLACSYEACDHEGTLPLKPFSTWIEQALAAGWVVVLWELPPEYAQRHAGGHSMAFCCAWCQYRAMRDNLLRQRGPGPDANYAARLVAYEEANPARERAAAFLAGGDLIGVHHEHEHGDG